LIPVFVDRIKFVFDVDIFSEAVQNTTNINQISKLKQSQSPDCEKP